MANAGVLLMRGHSRPFAIRMDGKCPLPQFRRAFNVLRNNEALRRALDVPQSDDGKTGVVLTVRDYALRDLFTLLRLQDWLQSDPRAPECLQVALLDQQHLNDWFKSTSNDARANLLSGQGNPAAAEWHNLELAVRSRASSASASSAHPSPVLQFRLCVSLAEALQGFPVRVLFLPNLMWYTKQASQQALEVRLSELQAAVRTAQHQSLHAVVHVYPPRGWDALLENKDDVYKKFQSVMLPTVWLPVARPDSNVALRRDAFQETASWLVHRLPSGRYVLKASYADCAQAVRTDIQLEASASGSNAVPARLVAAMEEFHRDFHQIKFGLQRFIEDLPANEFRHWYMALPDNNGTRTFRLVATVRTKYSGPSPQVMSAVASSPLDPESVACYDLAQRIMTGTGDGNQAFIQLRDDLLEIGCYALRVDCGYDRAERKAFLNELTAPADAAIFTHAHETALVWKLGEMLAEGVIELLQRQ